MLASGESVITCTVHPSVGWAWRGRLQGKASAPHEGQNAIACLDKAIDFRQEDRKKHAQTRRCRGQCPESANFRDCRCRSVHEFMHNLMRERKEAMESFLSAAMDMS
jgi:hypothetical protein